MSGNINENTFVGLTYHELSQEGFGLPSIRSMKFASEQDVWKNQLVIKATDKVKQFAAKKKLDYDIKVDQNDSKSVIKTLLALRGYTNISDDVIEKAKKFISFKQINGVTIAVAKMSYTTGQVFGVGLLTLLSSVAVGVSLGGLSLGISIPAAVLSSVTIGKLGQSILNKRAEKNASKYEGVFESWAILGHKGTSLDNLGSITLKQFCNGIITGSEKSKKSVEDLESDEVSMTDLVENETTVEEDAGKDSEVTNVDIPQDDSAHNEEASSGGVVTPDNKDDLEVKQTSTEAWYDDPAYSLEETGEDGVCMQCLVDNETTVEEDAGKDSEVKDSKPTEAETEHNEEASAGGVLTGDNKDNLEVKETSEEVLGITDYDLYSEDEYKSLEGVFDPDDLK